MALAAGLIVSLEGVPTTDYLDIVKVPTACAGHTGPDVHVGQKRTIEECMAMLQADLPKYTAAIDKCVTNPNVPAASWAAFISFSYNVGPTAFCQSTMARMLNAGDLRGACAQMSRWTSAGGQVQKGLINRRVKERAQCERGLP